MIKKTYCSNHNYKLKRLIITAPTPDLLTTYLKGSYESFKHNNISHILVTIERKEINLYLTFKIIYITIYKIACFSFYLNTSMISSKISYPNFATFRTKILKAG